MRGGSRIVTALLLASGWCLVGRAAPDSPRPPSAPDPPDEARDVSLDTDLHWNGVRAAETPVPSVHLKTIYGQDDRLDEYQVFDGPVRAAGDATVAVVSTSDLIDNGDGTLSLSVETLAEYYWRQNGRPSLFGTRWSRSDVTPSGVRSTWCC